MKILLGFILLMLMATKVVSADYSLRYPVETDSLLVAYVIKTYVDDKARFSVFEGSGPKQGTPINTPDSPYRRNARFTAFDSVTRQHNVENSCIDTIRPIVRLLEMTPWRKHEVPEALRFERDLAELLPVKPGVTSFNEAFSFIDRYCSFSSRAVLPVAGIDFAFIGLTDEGWKIVLYNKEEDSFTTIETAQEPHTFDYDFQSNRLVYIGADKVMRMVVNNNEEMLLRPGRDGYTQPRFIPQKDTIVLVKLVGGSSAETEIISFDPSTKEKKSLIAQRAAVLEPDPINDKELYYSLVSCVDDCGRILQEIWHKNTRAQQSRQLTLLNATSHQPNGDTARQWVYFSSDKKGNYHIWRLSLATGDYEKLTEGKVTDSHPQITESGLLYFLRSTNGNYSLLKRESNGNLTEVPLPDKYKKIRELRIGYEN